MAYTEWKIQPDRLIPNNASYRHIAVAQVGKVVTAVMTVDGRLTGEEPPTNGDEEAQKDKTPWIIGGALAILAIGIIIFSGS